MTQVCLGSGRERGGSLGWTGAGSPPPQTFLISHGSPDPLLSLPLCIRLFLTSSAPCLSLILPMFPSQPSLGSHVPTTLSHFLYFFSLQPSITPLLSLSFIRSVSIC